MGRRVPPRLRRTAVLIALSFISPFLIASRHHPQIGHAWPAQVAAPIQAAPSPSDALRTLREYSAAGKLDGGLLDGLAAKGSADGIVVLDENAISARIRQGGAASGTAGAAGGDPRAGAYAAVKQQIAAAVPDSATIVEDFPSFGSARVRVTSDSALLALLSLPQVSAITADEQYREQEAQPANPKPPISVDLALIGQPQAAAAGFTGAGASVAVLDTGVDYWRDAFGGCTAPGQPIATCRIAELVPIAPNSDKLDSDGKGLHGTSVAGIVAAVAPNARVIMLDVFDGGSSSTSLTLRGLDWVMQHQQQYNIVAVNLSLGSTYVYRTSPCSASPYTGVFDQMRRAGIIPVVASGNDAMTGSASGFTNGIDYPACVPGAVSVGATYVANIGSYEGSCRDASTQTDQVACFSQSGPNLSLLAPGARITAAGLSASGTSEAAPHVAAAAADLAAKCRAATADQIVEALTEAGPQVADQRNGVTKHRLDIAAAGQALVDAGECGGPAGRDSKASQ
jgi:hypothetical protein